MYVRFDEQNEIIDFYNSDGLWIEGLSLEDTALFIAEVTKVLSEVKK